MKEIRQCFKKYFGFTGKAGVKEFWKWCFFVLGVSLVMAVIMAVMFAVWGNRIPASPAYEVACRCWRYCSCVFCWRCCARLWQLLHAALGMRESVRGG